MTIKELMNAINDKKAEAVALLEKDDIDGAKAAKNELDELANKLSIMQELEKEGEEAMKDQAPVITPERNPEHDFAQAARMGFRNAAATNNEGTAADGGYTVPQDIQTRINKFKEAEFQLENLVDVEKVTTNTGRRTYQTKAQHTGFSAVNEGASIGAKTGPRFSVMNYTIHKYAGYLPVTNELLADSDANITATLTEWLAKEDVATRNAQILAKCVPANAGDIVAISDIDDIKKAVNVDLGQAYAGGVRIITNDDGLNWLDTLKVTETVGTSETVSNAYLLKPSRDQTNPMNLSLAVGARVIPVTVVPNTILKSTLSTTNGTATVIPMMIGDMKEYCKLFDRQQLSIATSTEAVVGTGENIVNAFEMDMTLFRGIVRFDVEIKDADALVYGTVTVPEGE